jgi:hypothetical protein
MDVASLWDVLATIQEVLPTVIGFRFYQKELVRPVDMLVASDASDYGFGVITISCGSEESHSLSPHTCESGLVKKRLFSEREQKTSSTHRELIALAAVYSNREVLAKWAGQAISHLTDNKGVSAIMKIGSPVASLQDMAVYIQKCCREHNIHLRVHWRPRADPRMEAADARSRHFDKDAWGVDYRGYQEVLAFCSDTPGVDLFASQDNTKCAKFASKFAADYSLAVGINAFSLNWKDLGFFFACPPPKLIIPVLRQAAAQGAKGVWVVPLWPTAHYWPYLFPDGRHTCNLVTSFKQFRPRCMTGSDVENDTFRGVPSFDLLMCELAGACVSPFKVNLESKIIDN